MAAGRREQHAGQLASVLCMIANVHLDRFRRKTPFTPRDFLPLDLRPSLETLESDLTVDDMADFMD